jgi:hypothetical protein
MAYFQPKTIQGVTYTLDHLEPFEFELQTATQIHKVAVRFRCHCFTEELTAHHTPDFSYVHDGENRAFDVDRYTLSQLLPQMVQTLGNRSVYLSQSSNYFILRQNPIQGYSGPYLVFFNVIKAKKAAYDVVMNIESAYMKPNMVARASPVKFTTLIEKTAAGQTVPRGAPQTIKRK